MTVAVTVFALLELYKRGEAELGAARELRRDPRPGPPRARRRRGGRRRGWVTDAAELARAVEALLFLAATRSPSASWPMRRRPTSRRVAAALELLAAEYAPGRRGIAAARAGRRLHARQRPRRRGGRAAPVQPPARRDAQPGPGRDARDRRLPAAGLAPRDHPHPRRQRRLRERDAARARPDRGGRALAVRRRAVPHDTRFLKLFGLRSLEELPGHRPVGPDAGGARRAARAPAARRRGPRGGRPGRGRGVVRRAARPPAPRAARRPHRCRARA